MRGVLLLLTALMLFTSLGISTIAHAGEPLGCIDTTQSAAMPMTADCAMVAVSADADRGYPHHHVVCHADQIAALDDGSSVAPFFGHANQFAVGRISSLAPSPSRAALEPPQA